MTVLSGAEFKKKYPGPWFKWLRKDLTHHGFTYTPGINFDPVKFNPTGDCKPGGLYLMKSIKNLTEFYLYGPVLGIFDIPDDSQVYIESREKFKCDKVFLIETISSERDLIEYFKKAVENGCVWDSKVCEIAVSRGHLEILKYARENGCPLDSSTWANIVKNGQIEVLKILRENGCPWDSILCSTAALNGNLEVLKWAHENGYPWDAGTSSSAAINGHLEVLKWARENGCPWGPPTYLYASISKHAELIKWVKDNGCPQSCKELRSFGLSDQKQI